MQYLLDTSFALLDLAQEEFGPPGGSMTGQRSKGAEMTYQQSITDGSMQASRAALSEVTTVTFGVPSSR